MNTTRKHVRFNTLTTDEKAYLTFIRAEYKDLPTQLQVVESLNLSQNGKQRLRNTLQGRTGSRVIYVPRNANSTNARKSIVHTMNESDWGVFRALRNAYESQPYGLLQGPTQKTYPNARN